MKKKIILVTVCLQLAFASNYALAQTEQMQTVQQSAQQVQAKTVELTLNQAIDMALNNNPKITIAKGSLKSAEGNKKQIIGQYGLQANYQYAMNRSHNYQSLIDAGVTDRFSNTTSVSYPLYTGGKRKGSVDAARRNLEIANLEVSRTDQVVKLDATQAYFTVLQTRNMVILNKESVTRLEDHLKNTKARYEVGVVAKVDVLRSEVELANAQQELIKAQNNYDVAVATLNNIVGLPQDTNTLIQDDLTYSQYDKELEGCLNFARQHQPQLMQAYKSVQAAKSSIMAARSGYLPSVTLSSSYGWGDKDFPGDRKSNWEANAVLSFSIFDSNTTRGAVDNAQGNLIQKEAELKQVEDNIYLLVRTYFFGFKEAEKRISTAQIAVETAKEDYKIAQVRYQAGVGTNTDVIDAAVALTQAQTNYVQALYDYNTSLASLESAMGVPVVR